MAHGLRCACGEVLRGSTGELLLEVVERHAEQEHALLSEREQT